MRKLLTRFFSFGKQCPKLWISAWIVWFFTLWFLSSGTPAPKEMPKIPHLDKIAHFGFFFGGAGLFSAWLRHRFLSIPAKRVLLLTTISGALVGAIDEYHQSFTPGRTGNDVYDWLADVSGSIAGAVVMLVLLKMLFKRTPQISE